MTVQILPNGKNSFEDAVGAPLNGGKLYTYASGTLTPLATYSDAAGTTPNANPIILDSRGEAIIYWAQGTSYRVILTDSLDNVIWPAIDGISGVSVTAAFIVALGLRFRDLTDTFSSFTGRALQVLRVNAGESGIESASVTLGATAFTGLTDTFASYTGKANQPVVVNSGATGLTTDGTQLGDQSYKMSANQVLVAATATAVQFNTAVSAQLKVGTYSDLTYTYTAGAAGARIFVSAQVKLNISNGEDILLWIEKNSTTKLAQTRIINEVTSGSGDYYAAVNRLVTLAASDTVRIRVQCSAARTIDSALESSFFDIIEMG